jgi:COMPASS component SWD3
LRTFRGHSASVTHACFNPAGNLLVTGSRDATVRFYDVASGTCVKTLSRLLGCVRGACGANALTRLRGAGNSEISSLALSCSGDKLLTSSKDSSNRLFDVRTGEPLQRYKGHQNSKLNFVRAQFGPGDALVAGGSEDGRAFLWDTESGETLTRLCGHTGPVFRAVWSDAAGRLATCAEDGLVRVWGASAHGAE